MPHLERLRADHADELLDFETRNRAHFAASVPDRGDDYFADFANRHAALLAEQDIGTIHMHVVIDGDVIAGRVNLVDVADGAAELGYRIGQSASGRGLATWAVGRVCQVAAAEYGLRLLHAKTTWDNPASQAVLARTGFVPVGELRLNGKPARRFQRDLTAPPHPEAST